MNRDFGAHNQDMTRLIDAARQMYDIYAGGPSPNMDDPREAEEYGAWQVLGKALEPFKYGSDTVSPEVAAGILGIDPKLVVDKARRGTLPGWKEGSRWRFSRFELYKTLAEWERFAAR